MTTQVAGRPVRPTRVPGLGYTQVAPGLWRVVDLCDPGRPATVGPHYRTQGELLADLDRYARSRGTLP